MTFYRNTLTGIDIYAFTLAHVNHLKRSKSLYFNNLLTVQPLIYDIKQRQDKRLRFLLRQAVFVCNKPCHVLNKKLTHYPYLHSLIFPSLPESV